MGGTSPEPFPKRKKQQRFAGRAHNAGEYAMHPAYNRRTPMTQTIPGIDEAS